MVNESSEGSEKFSSLHATLSWHNKSISEGKPHITLVAKLQHFTCATDTIFVLTNNFSHVDHHFYRLSVRRPGIYIKIVMKSKIRLKIRIC